MTSPSDSGRIRSVRIAGTSAPPRSSASAIRETACTSEDGPLKSNDWPSGARPIFTLARWDPLRMPVRAACTAFGSAESRGSNCMATASLLGRSPSMAASTATSSSTSLLDPVNTMLDRSGRASICGLASSGMASTTAVRRLTASDGETTASGMVRTVLAPPVPPGTSSIRMTSPSFVSELFEPFAMMRLA